MKVRKRLQSGSGCRLLARGGEREPVALGLYGRLAPGRVGEVSAVPSRAHLAAGAARWGAGVHTTQTARRACINHSRNGSRSAASLSIL